MIQSAHLRMFVATLALVLWAVGGTGTASAQKAPPSGFADIAERLLPAVVNISTTQNLQKPGAAPRVGPDMPQFPPGSPFEEFFKEFFDRRGGKEPGTPPQQQRRATSLGSGFIIDAKKGLIVTNNHVIQDADEITIILHDDTNLKAEVRGRDSKTDLAILKVTTEHPLVAVTFGDSDVMRVGDWVLAIGNPFGLGGTVTAGIVSARARDINAGPYDDFLQTDASINRGNSGGPMFNLNGEVIGINTAIFSPSGGSVGIGFAIPSNLAKLVVGQLREFGHTRRGWLGVRIQGVTQEIADTLGLTKPHGALVASVTPNGPAAVAGIQQGDVVLTFDGKEVNEMRKLPRIVADTKIEKGVPVVVWRKGQQVTFQVKVGELEAAEESGLLTTQNDDHSKPGQARQFDKLGLKLSAISTELRQQFELAADVKGVVIVEVQSGSPAGEKNLRPGDVIVEVSQQEVTNPTEVADRVKKAREEGKKSVLMLVDHQGELRFVALPLGEGEGGK
ncbi:putative periplasmic serine endoprotease DegP-like [uncultured Gammaproteobacteria bacterium]